MLQPNNSHIEENFLILVERKSLMKKSLFILLALLLLNAEAVFSQSKKELKAQENLEKYNAMKSLVDSKKFAFSANVAFTQKGRRIDLSSSGNSLIIDGPKSVGDLPFFGVVQIGAIGGDGGIVFENEQTEYDITYKDKKQIIIVKFSAKNKSENFDFILSIKRSGYADLSVNSNFRNSMTYNGNVSPLLGATD